MFRKLMLVSSFALASQALAAEAGKVIYVAGAAHVAERPVVEGAAVQEGEMLTTGADGYIYVRTVDNGLFILRPNTKARIAAYHVDENNPANTRVKLELLSGVARSKSGDAVKLARQNFRFNTPVAAIGVRGTDFTVYTDQDTSRVAVLTGRVVVSGFVGGCGPEGSGPCTGLASRELSAAQRGQLLQVKRGQEAPQMLPNSGNSPDLVSPPRPDEPVAKTGNAADPILDAKKSELIDKLVQLPQQPPAPGQPSMPPPVMNDGPPAPQLPTRELQWGRWVPLLGNSPTIAFTGPADSERILGAYHVIFRTAGADYVPERGSVGFTLKDKDSEAVITDKVRGVMPAQLTDGLLNVDFDKSTFSTSFNLVGDGSTVKLYANGDLSSSGTLFTQPESGYQTHHVDVRGALSNANGGTAAYVFHGRLDLNREVDGVTYWGKR
jgi:hypothetical protein